MTQALQDFGPTRNTTLKPREPSSAGHVGARSTLRRLGAGLGLVGALVLATACESKDEPSAIEAAKEANAAKSAAAKASADALAALVAKQAKQREESPSDEAPLPEISCAEGSDADFHDEALEAEVRRKLEQEEGPIAKSALKKVRSINLARGGTKTDYLDPCIFPHLTGVKDLFLGPGRLRDISLLKHMRGLTALRASMNRVEDVSVLAGMQDLDRLDLGRTQVSDVGPLSGLKNLTELMLDDTAVADVSALASLEKLEVLALSRTQVKDISPLKGLTKLKSLTITGAPVENPMAVSHPGLKVIND